MRGSGTASPPAPCLHPRPRCFENSAWRPSAVSIPQTPLTDWNPIVPCSSPHPQTGTWTHFPDEQSGLGSSVWKMGLECPRRGWGPRERKEKCAQLKAGVAVARSGAADVRGTRGGPGQGGASEAPCSPQTGDGRASIRRGDTWPAAWAGPAWPPPCGTCSPHKPGTFNFGAWRADGAAGSRAGPRCWLWGHRPFQGPPGPRGRHVPTQRRRRQGPQLHG